MSLPAPSVGEVYGHYRLIEQIGAGGMGVVFRAHDEQLRRDVALKVITGALFADETGRERFRTEALAVGRLNHPNIAMAFDFGAENGVDYLVTEYIPGCSLEEKIGKQPLPPRTVLELGLQLLSGLEAAHREQVIHRDLKPANIRLNREGQLKILDFGLAKLIDAIDENCATAGLSSDISVTGTLPYMSPELLRGQQVDGRADIWAAGAVLYEMATGKRAYPDKQPSLLIDAILHYDPVRPTLINPEVSPSLEAIILRALDRDPDGRYQNAGDMRADLARLLAGEHIAPETAGRSGALKAGVRARRKKLLLGVVGVLAAGIAIGTLVRHWWIPPARSQQILAVLPIEAVGQDDATTALGMGLTETLAAKLVQAGDSNSVQIVSPRDIRDQKVRTADEAKREFGADMVLESSLQKDGQSIRVNSFLVDTKTHRQLAARTVTVDANDSFGLQDRVVSETLDMLPTQLDPEQRRKLAVRQDTQPAAYEAYIRGRGYLLELSKPEDIDNAIAEFSKAIKIDPNFALAYASLGKTYWAGFRYFFKGNDWNVQGLNNCQKALSLNVDLVEGHVCLGNVLNGTGKYQQAVEEFQRALKTEPGSEDALGGLAEAYTKLGNLAGAEQAYKEAIALRPNYWGLYNWLGAFYFKQNRYADASKAFLRATQLAPNGYLGYVNLGAADVSLGQYEEAIQALQHAISLRPSADAYNNLGYAYTLMGHYPEAIAALEQGLKVDGRDWMNWGNLGDALYWSSNRRADSTANYRKAISIATSQLRVNPQDAFTLAYLANYLAMTGNKEGAYDALEKALKLAPSDGEVLYRAAVVHSHFNDPGQALSYLGRAVQEGYSRSIIRDTPDFTRLREDPRFRAVVGNP